jgi:hypothetical protein
MADFSDGWDLASVYDDALNPDQDPKRMYMLGEVVIAVIDEIRADPDHYPDLIRAVIRASEG